MITGKTMVGGENYHENHLTANDYYEKNKQVQGFWVGQACELYGVKEGDVVTSEAFDALRTNKHAITGEQITLRNNTTRLDENGKEVSNRRAFYDFTLSAPKSFSVLGVTCELGQVRTWHDKAVRKVIQEMENWVGRQDHSGPKKSVETTGKFAAAWYKHDANRSLEPNLHDHLVIFNLTPSANGKSYAIESSELFNRTKYFTAVYRDELAFQAIKSGALIEFDKFHAPQIKTPKDSLMSVCDLFSSRTKIKEELVKRCEELVGSVLTNNEVTIIVRSSRGLNKELFDEQLRHYEFSGSREQIIEQFGRLVFRCADGRLAETTTESVLKNQWNSLNHDQKIQLEEAILSIDGRVKQEKPPSLHKGISHAIEDKFERKSVAFDYEIYESALKHSCGQGIDLKTLKSSLESCVYMGSRIIKIGTELTTKSHLAQEKDLIQWISDARGTINGESLFSNFNPSDKLSFEQKQAVLDILGANDDISVLVGQAGTGKTFTTSEIVRANIEANQWVHMIAPSNGARDVLRKDGKEIEEKYHDKATALPFQQAKSLQMLLQDTSLQSSIPKGSLVIMDEAGLASVKQIHELIKLARNNSWRLLLVGDPKQHTSVEAGDGLRIILRNTSVNRARLSRIKRQKTSPYRSVAQDLAKGQTTKAFDRMDAMGAIIEQKGVSHTDTLVKTYFDQYDPSDDKSVILVTPTHREIEAVSRKIRDHLKEKGVLSKNETMINTLHDLSWTYAQKKDYRNYERGHVIFKNTGKKKGESFVVEEIIPGKGIRCLDQKGKEIYFTQKDAKDISICSPKPLPLSLGDKIMNRSGQKKRSTETINGEILTFSGLDAKGHILTAEGKTLKHNRISYAYASTSHKSQGATFKNVIIGFDKQSIRTADQKLAYVAGTRGTTSITLVVENKEDLLSIENRTGDRKSALELLEQQKDRKSAHAQERMNSIEKFVEKKPNPQIKVPSKKMIQVKSISI